MMRDMTPGKARMLATMDANGRETWTMASFAGPGWQQTLHAIRALPESTSDADGRVRA